MPCTFLVPFSVHKFPKSAKTIFIWSFESEMFRNAQLWFKALRMGNEISEEHQMSADQISEKENGPTKPSTIFTRKW